MAFLAGERITAERLNRLQPKTYSAPATGSLTRVDSTWADIPGCTVTLTTEAANARYDVIGIFDCSVGATSSTVLMDGRLVVDGVADASVFAIHAMDTLDRDTVAQAFDGTLATPGIHTLKLQGTLSGPLATGGTFQVFSKIKVVITEVA